MKIDLLYINDNALDEEFCKLIIDKFEKDDRKYQGTLFTERGTIVDLDDKTSTELKIANIPGWEDISDKIRLIVKRNIDMYFSEFVDFLRNTHDLNEVDIKFVMDNTFSPGFEFTDYEIQRIDSSKHYRWHQDFAIERDCLQCIIYLNTLNEGDGGETKLLNGAVIRPNAGKMLIMPCTWTNIHTGCVVNTDHKYIIAFKIERRCPPK